MSESAPIHVLIHAARSRAAQWAETLACPTVVVWREVDAVPPHGQPDVILTDEAVSLEQWTTRADPGIVRVGASGPADEHLPADATAREVTLACRLVGRIVQLRRQLRSGREIHDRLSRAAFTDPLTGLPNRRAWDESIPVRLGESTSSPGWLCLAIVDLDRFKRVNDQFGHVVGDEVLRAAAKALREGLRQDDLLARLGGDEFGLLVRVPSPADALGTVDRARRSIAARGVPGPGCVVTASAGLHVVEEPMAADRFDELFSAADAALRDAKRQGRNRTVRAEDRIAKG